MVVSIAVLAVAFWRFSTPKQPQDALAVVQSSIETQLAQPVGLAVEFDQTAGPWQLICGTVTAPGGGELVADTDTTDALLAESRDVCALLDISDIPRVVELDIGSTDMPAMDWLEQYDLPPELLQGG
jgi:hypothetical protein